jgi:hypothetical protein
MTNQKAVCLMACAAQSSVTPWHGVIANVLPSFSFTMKLYPNRGHVPSSPSRTSLTAPKHAATVHFSMCSRTDPIFLGLTYWEPPEPGQSVTVRTRFTQFGFVQSRAHGTSRSTFSKWGSGVACEHGKGLVVSSISVGNELFDNHVKSSGGGGWEGWPTVATLAAPPTTCLSPDDCAVPAIQSPLLSHHAAKPPPSSLSLSD